MSRTDNSREEGPRNVPDPDWLPESHRRLQEISGRVVPAGDKDAFYGDLIDAAMEITEADRGTLQFVDEETGALQLLQSRGIPAGLRETEARVDAGGATSCAKALRRRERVVVDYLDDPPVAGTPDARKHLAAGIRCAQSTPLITRSGRLIGMLSTHWTRPGDLSERQGHLLDILARQAADLIDRAQVEAELRRSERNARLRSEQFELLVNQAPIGICFVDADFCLQQLNPVAARHFSSIRGGGIGRNFDEVLTELWGSDHAPGLSRLFRHTLETGEPRHAQTFGAERADRGQTEHYEWSIERLELSEGMFGVVCYFRETTDQVKTRLAAGRSDLRYHRLLQSMDQGFAVITILRDNAGNPVDYRFEHTNPAFERHTGLENAAGRKVLELVPNLERLWIERYGRVAATGEPEVFEAHSEALGRWFEVEAFRIGDSDSHQVAMLFSDISQQKAASDALRESEERLRLAKSAARLGIHDFNPITGEIGWDDRTREIWGVGEDEAVTYDLWLAGIHPADRGIAEAAVVRSLDPLGDGIYMAEYRVVCRRDETIRWIAVTGQATFVEGRATRLVGTVQDITEQKAAQKALVEADRRKDEFLATLAHELRSPLSAIRTATAMLGELLDDRGPVSQMTSIIERQSSHLVRLINDLMDVSRISLGKVQLERSLVDVGEVVEEAATALSAMCEGAGVTATFQLPETPVLADADPVRLAQVMTNLVQNACKFTPRGGTIRIQVEQDGAEARVRLTDSGIGMTPEKLARIFDLFEQGETSPSLRTEGLGIGLSLSRSIVELHGGSLEAYSEGPGRGSEFVVRLPAIEGGAPTAPDPEGGVGSQRRGEPTREGRRIVLAEDNRDALHALTLVLRSGGHEVFPARDGREALEQVRANRPDVVILDIGMPVMDGFDVARAIRAEPWGGGPTLVALTGWGQDRDREMAMEAGFDAHLTKPASLDTLDAVLRAAGSSTRTDASR